MMRKIRGVVKKTDILRSIEIRYPFFYDSLVICISTCFKIKYIWFLLQITEKLQETLRMYDQC